MSMQYLSFCFNCCVVDYLESTGLSTAVARLLMIVTLTLHLSGSTALLHTLTRTVFH